MDRYFNPEIETASREYLWALQSARLIKMVHNAYDHVPFYQKKFDEIGLLPGDIKTIDDITKLPFTVKQDLRDNYPFGLFAVPKDRLVRIHASSAQRANRRLSAIRRMISTYGRKVRRAR